MIVVPVIHPAATFRSPADLGPLSAHVANFLRLGVLGEPANVTIHIEPDYRALQTFLKQCRTANKPIAVDVESAPMAGGASSTATLPGYARLRAIGIGADIGPGIGLSWFYPVKQPGVWELLKTVMKSEEFSKVLCNGFSYDIPLLRRYGVSFKGPIHDIKDARRALSSTSRVGLGPQAAMYLGCGPWKAEAKADETDEKGHVDTARIPREKLLGYNAEDCIRTAQIETHHRREMNADPADEMRIKRLYWQQMALARAASEMHMKGFPVDQVERKRLSRELTKLGREKASAFKRLIKPYAPAFRISATGGTNDGDMRALLFRECSKKGINSFNLEIPMSGKSRTEGGQASVNKDALLILFAQGMLPDELQTILKMSWQVNAPLKARSTFVDSEMVSNAIGPDGRMHPKVNSCGTETGRWSCKSPNLFNLSEQQEEGKDLRGDLPSVRSMYVAPRGYTIVHRDYDQLELQVMKDVTGDALLTRLLASEDVHTTRAREWFKIPAEIPVPAMIRKQGKVVGFASQYSAGVEAVYLTVLKTVIDARFQDVQAMWEKFRETHVGIREHWENSISFAELHGYCETAIMHRRLYYPPGVPLKPTETSNYRIQGTAADIANCAMVGMAEASHQNSIVGKLHKYFPKAWLAMHVYDSFDIICEKKDAGAVDRLLEDSMNGPWKVGEKAREFKSKGKTGERWSDV